jgi:hypothetical protein
MPALSLAYSAGAGVRDNLDEDMGRRVRLPVQIAQRDVGD